jgi:hypothetical protein
MNNFNTSTTGVNIEFNGFYDIGGGQDNFNENFVLIPTDGSSALNSMYSKVTTYLYIDFGNVDPDGYKVSKIVPVRGYSQGDYVEVIVPRNLGFKKGFDFADYFQKLIYRSPVYARLTVNGEDDFFNFEEYTEDQYSYDKNEFLVIAEKHIDHDKKQIILDFLAANLPADLDYI